MMMSSSHFSGFYCFGGSRVHKSMPSGYSLDVEFNSASSELSQSKFELKHREICRKYEQKSSFFMIPIPKFILKICLIAAPFLNFKEFLLANT